MPDVDGGCQSQDQQCHPCWDNALPHLTHDRIAGLRLKSETLPRGDLHHFAESSYLTQAGVEPTRNTAACWQSRLDAHPTHTSRRAVRRLAFDFMEMTCRKHDGEITKRRTRCYLRQHRTTCTAGRPFPNRCERCRGSDADNPRRACGEF